MTTIGAATHSPPAIRSQPPAPSPKKAGPDNDGDEATESASTKAAEAGGGGAHKLNVQA